MYLKQQWSTELLSLDERSWQGRNNLAHFEVGLNKGSKIKLANLSYDICNLSYDICNLSYDICNLSYDFCNLSYDFCNLSYDFCNLS
jgi:hypothetical protein